METSRSPSGYGSGASNTPSTTLKPATVEPIANPRVSTTVTVNEGDLNNLRLW
ncbi:hypothetical protein D3C83_143200 [compost metagenome]